MRSTGAQTGSPSRFKHVGPTLRTGTTTASVPTITSKEVASRRAESFRRLTPSQLAAILEEEDAARSTAAAGPGSWAGSGGGGGGGITRMVGAPPPSAGPRMVVVGAEESGHAATRFATSSLCLLDARDIDEYAAFHLAPAMSAPLLSFRQDRVSAAFAPVATALVGCRHRRDRRIVVVDWDERAAAEVASRLVASGHYAQPEGPEDVSPSGIPTCGVFILSGGLKTLGTQMVYEALQWLQQSGHDLGGTKAASASVAAVLRRQAWAPLAPYVVGSHVPTVLTAVAREMLPVHLLSPALAALGSPELDLAAAHAAAAEVRAANSEARLPARTIVSTATSKAIGGSPMRMPGAPASVVSTFGSSARFRVPAAGRGGDSASVAGGPGSVSGRTLRN